MNAAAIASWASLKIRRQGLKIEALGPQNGSTKPPKAKLPIAIALQFPAFPRQQVAIDTLVYDIL